MLEVISSLIETRNYCKTNWNLFDESLPAYENTFRSMWNALVITIELLECYKKQWSSESLAGKTPRYVKQLQNQRWDRVTQISKWAFISIVSNIEYTSKRLIQKAQSGPLISLAKRKRIYLRDIITQSKKVSLVQNDTHQQWLTLIKLRNFSVHNATFVDETGDYTVGNVLIQFREGEMLQGNLLFYAKMTHSIVYFFKSWLDVFLEKHVIIA